MSVVCSNYASFQEFGEVPVWKDGKNKICYIGGISKIRGIVQVVEAIEKANVELELAGEFSSSGIRTRIKKYEWMEECKLLWSCRKNSNLKQSSIHALLGL